MDHPVCAFRDAFAVGTSDFGCAYLLFEGEQHAFRTVGNISRGLSAELTSYVEILGSEPADRLPSLEIRNLPPGRSPVPGHPALPSRVDGPRSAAPPGTTMRTS